MLKDNTIKSLVSFRSEVFSTAPRHQEKLVRVPFSSLGPTYFFKFSFEAGSRSDTVQLNVGDMFNLKSTTNKLQSNYFSGQSHYFSVELYSNLNCPECSNGL